MTIAMIYVTGDLHGPLDIGKLSFKNWPASRKLTRDDYLIVCGDAGLVWDQPDSITGEEVYWLHWLSMRPWTTLFIDGNHENFDRLNALPVVDKFGGKVHDVFDNVYHLMRGEYYTLDGRTVWTMGGATSTDKHLRREGVDWWPQEVPTKQEFEYAVENLRHHGGKADIAITHDCPKFYIYDLYSRVEPDPVRSFLDFVLNEFEIGKWYCGHHHVDRKIDDLFTFTYNKIIKV